MEASVALATLQAARNLVWAAVALVIFTFALVVVAIVVEK